MARRVEVHASRSETDTMAIGRALGRTLGGGATVLLFGELGAGKTTFVRGLADGLGCEPDDVTSPTFTLVQQYSGAAPLYHVDLYRLDSGESEDLGLEELREGSAVVAVEWAEKLARPPIGAVIVRLEDTGGDTRRIVIESPEPPTGTEAGVYSTR